MEFEVFFRDILYAVITACAPVLTVYLVKYIKRLADVATSKVESQLAQRYIDEIADAVTNAVACINQVYVDSLKASGSFDVDAQTEARSMALDAVQESLSQSAIEFIESVYGDFTSYVYSRIEAEVRTQKMTASALQTGEIILTDDAAT